MVTKELSEAAVEFNCIFKYFPEQIKQKVPTNFIEFIKEIESKTYKFEYDTKHSLNEQKLKTHTRGLIALVYRDYICNEEQRKDYLIKCANYKKEKEEKLREIYNPENLFKNKNSITNEISTENVSIIKCKDNTILKKIIDKIKNIFKKG